jgi:hypothetical protein
MSFSCSLDGLHLQDALIEVAGGRSFGVDVDRRDISLCDVKLRIEEAMVFLMYVTANAFSESG